MTDGMFNINNTIDSIEGLRAYIDREMPIIYSMEFEHLTGCGDGRHLPVEECPRYAEHRAEGEAFADALQLREARQRVAQTLAAPLRNAFAAHVQSHGCGTPALPIDQCPDGIALWRLQVEGDAIAVGTSLAVGLDGH